MKRLKEKKSLIKELKLLQAGLFLALVCLFGAQDVEALSEEEQMTELYALVAAYEPSPYEGRSIQETNPFDPFPLDPEVFIKEIGETQSPDEVQNFLHDRGIPLSPSDGEYIYYNKSRLTYEQYSLHDQQALSSVMVVSFAYSEETNDNLTFIFSEKEGVYTLIDCINCFGNIEVINDDRTGAVWLVGETGVDNRTIRWYHLQSKTIVLSYLAQGMMADRMDYHIKVTSQLEPSVEQMVPSDRFFSIRKQVSVFDLITGNTYASKVPEIVLFTQVDVYEIQPDGSLRTVGSKQYNGMDLLAVAEIENDQIFLVY